MGQESLNKEEQLFLYLINTFKTSAWIALGKMKNPVTGKTEINMEQASYYIDLLEMLQSKARGNMSEYEEDFLAYYNATGGDYNTAKRFADQNAQKKADASMFADFKGNYQYYVGDGFIDDIGKGIKVAYPSDLLPRLKV